MDETRMAFTTTERVSFSYTRLAVGQARQTHISSRHC